MLKSVATVIICTYYLFATGSKPELYNHIAILVLEVFMELWWLSAFSVTAWTASALSIYAADFDYVNSIDPGYNDGLSGSWKGAYIAFAISAAVSAFEWYVISKQ
jgi:hypothetical protein